MIRHTIAALIVLAAGVGGSAATPSESEFGFSSETAPFRSEAQAAPKAFNQAPGQAPVPAPVLAAPKPVPETQGLAQSQTPNPQPGAIPDRPPAQDRAPSTEEQRFSFHRVKDGFLRLDSQTGQVTQCGWSATGWSCNAVPDERAALDSEIARLQGENAALKKSLLSHGVDLPASVKPDVSAHKEEAPTQKQPEMAPPPRAPSEADLNRAIAFMKNVWRRLVELMVDLQRDIQRKS